MESRPISRFWAVEYRIVIGSAKNLVHPFGRAFQIGQNHDLGFQGFLTRVGLW
jgi:hypothetical protein